MVSVCMCVCVGEPFGILIHFFLHQMFRLKQRIHSGMSGISLKLAIGIDYYQHITFICSVWCGTRKIIT